MFLGKVALLLVAFAIISPHPVTCNHRCTEEQKKHILLFCKGYIKKGFPIVHPRIGSTCCDKVLEVPNLDMQCIVDELTTKEKEDKQLDLDEAKNLGLRYLCSPFYEPPPRHHQVARYKQIAAT
ncbi:hypothetical protein HU200_063988 [Digitaria exilis]|uniref:Bifunctional inhibitor/plant lipid transfer protein/seed storage helical domain-containing protein n=1 Tax=Digitaria exilis TaxID=1010633 RepID=A0A835A0M1_9POAL|nr:hypothetical protein HU200_063988 [Digitaria exilis]